MNTPLHQVLQRPDIWRAGDRHSGARDGLATGHPALDRLLRGGGWPRAALTELLLAQPGSGELRLLLPLLAELSRRGLWQLWIAPPFIPYAPALAQGGVALERLVVVHPADRAQLLWACEQALRAPGCAAVLCWPGAAALRYTELRKLQVAAAEHQCCGFVLRESRAAAQPFPGALRLQLTATAAGLGIDILKQRGGRAGQRTLLPVPPPLQARAPLREAPIAIASSIGAATAAGTAPPLPLAATGPVLWQ